MDLAKAFADTTQHYNPVDKRNLVAALATTQQSGLLSDLVNSITHAMTWSGGVGDSDEDIVREVRAARMKLAVIQQLNDELARLVEKESDDA